VTVTGALTGCNAVTSSEGFTPAHALKKPVKRRYIARKCKLKQNINYNMLVFLPTVGQIQAFML
jgi:hypothetical protein